MDFENPLALARKVKLGSLGPLRRRALQPEDARRGRRDPADPARQARAAWSASWRAGAPRRQAGIAGAAITHGDDEMLIDEAGSVTFGEMHRRSNALARALRERGVEPGDGVAIMARNHRGFIDATLAASKLGANGLYMNTAFSGPQLVDVMEREEPGGADLRRGVLGAARRGQGGHAPVHLLERARTRASDPTTEELIESADDGDLDPPDESSRFIILTSGTTGTPKGAQRGQPDSLSPLAAMFSRIPLQAGETDGDRGAAVPLLGLRPFHARAVAELDLRPAAQVRPRGDPEGDRRQRGDRARGRAGDDAAHPPAAEETLDKYDLPSLRVTAASGSALPGPLAEQWMDHFGDNLYNLYGSTEVAWATIATPEDLRAAPGTAGMPPRGTVVKIVDSEGKGEVPRGETGRVFVGNDMAFEGYTGGGGKDDLRGPALLAATSATSTRRAGCSSTAATTR